MVAHNFGLTTLEEGQVLDGNKIILTSTNISRMNFAKDPAVVKIERLYELINHKLEFTLAMQTSTSESSLPHLTAIYEKVV